MHEKDVSLGSVHRKCAWCSSSFSFQRRKCTKMRLEQEIVVKLNAFVKMLRVMDRYSSISIVLLFSIHHSLIVSVVKCLVEPSSPNKKTKLRIKQSCLMQWYRNIRVAYLSLVLCFFLLDLWNIISRRPSTVPSLSTFQSVSFHRLFYQVCVKGDLCELDK